MSYHVTYAKPGELPILGAVLFTIVAGSLLWTSVIYSVYHLLIDK